MENKLSALYQSIILEKNKNPYHFQKQGDAQFTLEAYNPLCGDQFRIFINLDGDRVKEVYFHGYGCAISKASSSILAENLEGKTLEEAKAICQEFLSLVKDANTSQEPSSKDFLAFAGAKDFPSREQCATLSWESLEEFLAREGS